MRNRQTLLLAVATLCLATTLVTACGAAVAEMRPRRIHPTFANVPYAGPQSVAAQSLDIYTQKSANPAPLVIYIHGGGWIKGDKSHVRGFLHGLLSRGFAVASINYRLTDEAHWPAQINDTKAAIKFLRANAAKYNIDPDRIGLWGLSAGGQLAALAGTAGDATELENESDRLKNVSSKVQAVVDWYGPTDFSPYASGKEKLGDNVVNMVTMFFGGPVTEHAKEAKAASPAAYVTSDDPPLLIMHGTRDPLVPIWQSTTFLDAMKKAGVNATLVTVENAGHDIFGPQYQKQVLEFFESNLKRNNSGSDPE